MSSLCYVRTRRVRGERWVYTRDHTLCPIHRDTPVDRIVAHSFHHPMLAYYAHHVRDGVPLVDDPEMVVRVMECATGKFLPSFEYDVGDVDWLLLSRAYVAVWGTLGDDYTHPRGKILASAITSGAHSVLYPHRDHTRAMELTRVDDAIVYRRSLTYYSQNDNFDGLIEARTEAASMTLMLANLGPVIPLGQFRG